MNEVFKEKIKKIIMLEYRNQQHKGWLRRLQTNGIKVFQKNNPEIEYIEVDTGIFMGKIHIPQDLAEKILIFGGIP